MAEIYEFDPAQDLQVLETFTFEEEIERPENVRFYTLDDQVTDYFERRIPVGKVSRHALYKLQLEADRVRRLYEEVIVGTDTAFEVRTEKQLDGYLPWVTPVYAGTVQRRPLDWYADWTPLMAPRQPRYIERMVAGLPKPYTFAEGRRAEFSRPQRFVDFEGKTPIRAVPTFVRTRGVVHAGGRYEIIDQPIPNTQDDIAVRGYWIGKRPLDLIAPMEEHPFFSTNDPHFLESQSDYREILPSVEAVLTHAVPVTPHPFRDAAPYLKLYDVKWRDIPWSAWKRQFPPADPVSQSPPADTVAFPASTTDLPSEGLQKNYHIKYRPGMSPRYWLSIQEDAGALVQKMMLTQAGELSPITIPKREALVEPVTVNATPEDCLPDGLSFDQLVTAGVYRPPGICVPTETIAREKSELGLLGKLPWGETTQAEILVNYLPLLMAAQGPAPEEPKEPVIPRVEVPELSPLRKDVLAILADKDRTPEDKATDLRTLVSEMPVKNKTFLDQDEKFLLCEHTLALLSGDLGKNQRTYYETWCGIVDGSRVCKYCGEAVNRDVFVNVDEFDDDGHAMIQAEAPTVEEFHPGHVRTFTESLQALRPIFDTRDPAQDMLFLLLSILQVLPERGFLEPVLGQIRQLSVLTKSKGESAQALYGICGMVILMQTHDPFLVPRRSFGGPFMLSGWPREGDPADKGILDSLLGAIKRTFEEFRGSLKGPATGLLREVFRDVSKVRDKCVVALKLMTRPSDMLSKRGIIEFSAQLETAAVRYATAPPVPVQLTTLVPNIRIDTTEVAKVSRTECYPAVGLARWTTDTPPVTFRPSLEFRRMTTPGPTATRVRKSGSERTEWTELPKDTAARLGKALPPFVKKLLVGRVLEDKSISWFQASSIAGRLLDLATGIPTQLQRSLRKELEGLDPTLNPSQLRDAARGIAFATIHAVQQVPALRERWAEVLPKDLALKAILRSNIEVEGDVRGLVTMERETFKTRLGEKSDMDRELIKQLLDIGLAPYVITLRDRELFARQLAERLEAPNPLANPEVPEEGFQGVPDDREQNDADQGERGEFGDMPNRVYEGDDQYGTADPDRGV